MQWLNFIRERENAKNELSESKREEISLKILIRTGPKDGKPLMIVEFEEASNYDPNRHEWVPKIDEVKLIYKTLKSLTGVSLEA